MKTRTSTTSVGPVFDDFEPSTEFSENHEAPFLRILLPGFTREQMKITFMHFTRTLNISGERQIDIENDKWVRFNQSYPIPQNCEEGKLQAHFAHGVLTITMPKKIISQHSPKTEAQQEGPFPSKKQEPRSDRKAQEDISQKAREMPPAPRLEEPKPEKAQEKTLQKYGPPHVGEVKPEKAQEKPPQKYWPTQLVEPWPTKAQERMEGPEPEKAHEHIPRGSTPSKLGEQKPKEAHEEEIPFKFRIRRGNEDLIQKGQDEETEPKPIIMRPQRKPIDETEKSPTLKVAPKKPKDEKPDQGAEEIERERQSKKGELEGKLAGKPEKMFQEKEIRTRKRTEEEIAEKGKETFFRKKDIVSTIGKGMRQVSASTSEVATKISEGKWKEEEKPMLVNMGAAILVIAALGAYVSYKLTSSAST